MARRFRTRSERGSEQEKLYMSGRGKKREIGWKESRRMRKEGERGGRKENKNSRANARR